MPALEPSAPVRMGHEFSNRELDLEFLCLQDGIWCSGMGCRGDWLKSSDGLRGIGSGVEELRQLRQGVR